MEDMLIPVVLMVVGLVLFFLYLVLHKKMGLKEALEEVVDYAIEHKEELVKLTETDLLEMKAEEIEELCGSLGIPIDKNKAAQIAKILDYIKEKFQEDT